MSTDDKPAESTSTPRWQPLGAIERRVLGALIEKAKTTPENYPLSGNAVKTACNQKNNRAPLMQLEEEQVAEALEKLRKVGAVAEIQGGGRVDKYRHLAYDWLGVDKVELAVMAELLLRGSQTEGELRGRAARMEPIKDLGELQPLLESLFAKGLVVRLTPAGRGAIVTHALYLDHEMDKQRREAEAGYDGGASAASGAARMTGESAPRPHSDNQPLRPPVREAAIAVRPDELQDLRDELAAVRSEIETVRAEFQSAVDDFRRELGELNRQLGN